MDPVTVTVVSVPSIVTSVEASPTTQVVVRPSKVSSTSVLCVRTRSTVVPSREKVVVTPETVTSVEAPSESAVQVVVVPGTTNSVLVAVNSTSVLVAPTEVTRVEPGKEVVVTSPSCLRYNSPR